MGLFLGITLLVVSAFLLFIIWLLQKDSGDDVVAAASFGAVGMLLFLSGISLIGESCLPSIKPIDVYRGKTTLEINYRDSIAIDSTVVWKKEVK